MKKLTTLLGLLFILSMGANAQRTVWQDAISTTGTEGWTMFTGDGAATTNWVRSANPTTAIVSRRESDLNNNAWAITPGMVLENGASYVLSFQRRVFANNVAPFGTANLEVKLMNGVTADDAVGAVLWTLEPTTPQTQTGQPWVTVEVIFTVPSDGTYHIAFREFSPNRGTGNTSFYGTDVQTIRITQGEADFTPVISDVFPYTQVPVTQRITPSVTIRNVGKDATNLQLTVTLNGGSEIKTTPTTLDFWTSKTLTIATPQTIVSGENTLVRTVTHGDGNTVVFTDVVKFQGTPNVYAADNSTAADDAGANARAIGTATLGAPAMDTRHLVGNVFTITSAIELAEISMSFGNLNNNNMDFSTRLYRLNDAQDRIQGNCLLGGSFAIRKRFENPSPTVATVAGNWNYYPVPSGITLEPGNYYLAVEQTDMFRPFIWRDNSNRPTRTVSGSQLPANTALTTFTGNGAIHIRMIAKTTEGCYNDARNLAVNPGASTAEFTWEGDVETYEVIVRRGSEIHTGRVSGNTFRIAPPPANPAALGFIRANADYTWSVRALCKGSIPSPDTIHAAPFTTPRDTFDFGITLVAVTGNSGGSMTNAGTAVAVAVTVRNQSTLPTNSIRIAVEHNGVKLGEYSTTATNLGLAGTQVVNVPAEQRPNLSASGPHIIRAYVIDERDEIKDTRDTFTVTIINNTIDVAPVALLSPVTAYGLTNAETIKVEIKNHGSMVASNIPIRILLSGIQVASDTMPGPITGGETGEYTITTGTLNLSTPGSYQVAIVTGLANDRDRTNDSISVTVNHVDPSLIDVGVTAITAPKAIRDGVFLGLTATEKVSVTVINSGGLEISNVPIFLLHGDLEIEEEITTPIPGLGSITYEFEATLDLSVPGEHIIEVWTAYPTDQNSDNDFVSMTVKHWASSPDIPFVENFDMKGLNDTTKIDYTTTVGSEPATAWIVLPHGWTFDYHENSNMAFLWSGITGSRAVVNGVQNPTPINNALRSSNVSGYKDSWAYTPGLILEKGKDYRIQYEYWVGSTDTLEVYMANSIAGLATTQSICFIDGESHLERGLFVHDFQVDQTGIYYFGYRAYSRVTSASSSVEIYDISVKEIAFDNALAIMPTVATEFPFTQLPTTMRLPALSARAVNEGLAAQTDVTFEAKLNGNVLGTSTPVATLAAGARSSVMTVEPNSVHPVHPVSGANALVYTVKSAVANESQETVNSITYEFEGTDVTLALDGVTNDFSNGRGDTVAARLGNLFRMANNNMMLEKVVVGFAEGTTLNYSISLFEMTGETEIQATPVFTQNATRTKVGFETITLTKPIELYAGARYFLCVDQQTAESIAVAVDGNENKQYYRNNLTGNAITTVAGGALAIRMMFEIPTAVASVSLNKTTTSLKVGDQETLTATVLPEDATNKDVTWTSSNDAVATVNALGRITAVAAGTATITVTTDDGGHTAQCVVTVTSESSIVELEADDVLKVYPNPTSDVLYVQTEEAVQRIDVLNLQGQLLKQIFGDVNSISVSELSAGTYILKVTTAKGVVTQRFVKQ
jgi:hypothetical protein